MSRSKLRMKPFRWHPASSTRDSLPPRAELATGRAERGLQRLRSLAETHQDSADVSYELARAHESLGQHGNARAHYDRALSIDNSHFDARIGLGRLALIEGRPDEAATVAENGRNGPRRTGPTATF